MPISILTTYSLVRSSLPGWAKITFAARLSHVSETGKLIAYSFLLYLNYITCHDGLDIFMITMSNTGHLELSASSLEDAPVMLVCSVAFGCLKMRRSCINACNS